jgi:hypothetical protein
MTHTPLLCLLACSLAIPAAAQARADAPHTQCHNVGLTVSCTNVAPVSAAEALAIFRASAEAVEAAPPPFVPPAGSTYIGWIHGDVFSDRWPFESAGVYARLFKDHRGLRPHRVAPVLYPDMRLVVDPWTGRRFW